jgi:hypothetical protein
MSEQIDSLIRLIRWLFRPGTDRSRPDVYVAGNLMIYYIPNQKKSEFFRGPDIFVVLGVDPEPRRSLPLRRLEIRGVLEWEGGRIRCWVQTRRRGEILRSLL